MGTYCIMLLLSFSWPFYSSKAVFHDGHWQHKCLCIELSLITSPFVCFNFMILFLTDVQRPIPDSVRSGGVCVLPDVWKREAETCGGPGAAGHHRAVLQGWTHRKVRLATVAGVAVQFEFSVALRPQRKYRLLGTGSPGWPPPVSHSSWALTVQVQCCFTSTETVQTIHLGRGAQDGHLDFHTVPELWGSRAHINPICTE